MKKAIELGKGIQGMPHHVRTPYNTKPSLGQGFTNLSHTVPNQAYTVEKIIEMSRKGISLSVAQRLPVFDEESQGIDYHSLDLVEIQAIREANEIDLKTFNQLMKEENAHRIKEEREAKRLELKKQLEEISKETKGPDSPESV